MSATPEAVRANLDSVLEALHLDLTGPQIDTLVGYLDLLQRWNGVYNLTAVRDPAAMLTQHLADCLAVVTPLRRRVGDGDTTVLDVGSGGGLPAVVIATAMPNVRMTSVDSVGKKAAFVLQVAGELRLRNLAAVHGRVETLRMAPVAVVTARAFSSLSDLVRLSDPLLRAGGCWMAMKGHVPAEEIAAVAPAVDTFHVEQIEVPGLEAQRCIVWMQRKADRAPPYN